MGQVFDVIVVGLGANGSSALYHLSKTDKKVLGIDRFTPPHTHGSSHGQSRITRQAYHENPLYVPFVKEAYNLWYDLERISGKKLLLETGGVMLGNQDAAVIKGAILSAETYNVAYDYLTPAELQQRYPVFKPSENTVAVVEKKAGILFPEDCITTYLEQAQAKGAGINLDETVLSITPKNNLVEIVASKGTYLTQKVIVSAGAWVGKLLPELNLPLTVERQVLHWFRNKDTKIQPYLQPDKLPVYIWEYLPKQMFYGFPDLGDGMKIALHHAGKLIEPDDLTQDVAGQEISGMKAVIDQYFNMDAEYNYSAVCMFTNTPDEDFIIDYYPGNENIIVASPCSGHGFKFSSLTGKILSDMATGEKVNFDLSPFRIARFVQ